RQLHRAAGAFVDLGEADRDRRLDVDRLLPGSAAGRAAEDRTEDVTEAAFPAEQILHVLRRHRAVLDPRSGSAVWAEPSAASASCLLGVDARRLRRRPVLAELVVVLALARVGKDLVRLRQLLEARLRLPVVLVQVGVVLARQLAEGGRDLLVRR